MKRIRELTKEINDLTLMLEEQYPELYQYLDENPVTIPGNKNPTLNSEILSDYLDSLKQLLNHYIENHPKPT